MRFFLEINDKIRTNVLNDINPIQEGEFRRYYAKYFGNVIDNPPSTPLWVSGLQRERHDPRLSFSAFLLSPSCSSAFLIARFVPRNFVQSYKQLYVLTHSTWGYTTKKAMISSFWINLTECEFYGEEPTDRSLHILKAGGSIEPMKSDATFRNS